ncbi:hypothetical protein MRS76_24425 [Rhizobiaceae bacterium n13]|uniref:Uncharacterized protein n=1 Tax=Ferirhizobium litorale TaxID=2927786 RepID=A0AAE3QF80_9HYPH|nr:hypothetical protein [Fererhizobium litorale]MDI7865067.1 hypothetical protein [Fererhizobium litorale]MDI7922920.1 hypothetical protein [Fererhizobium litorale]
MRKRILGLMLVMASPAAAAPPTYDPTSLTCQGVRSVLAQNGAAILQYTSRSGLPIYNRYVANQSYCWGGPMVWRSVPTRDNPACPVAACSDRRSRGSNR